MFEATRLGISRVKDLVRDASVRSVWVVTLRQYLGLASPIAVSNGVVVGHQASKVTNGDGIAESES